MERIEIDLGPHDNRIVISQKGDGLVIRSYHGMLAIYPQAANAASIRVLD